MRQVNESISAPYAYLAMEIQQEPNSLQIITEIDPLDVAEMLGNVGGFWGEKKNCGKPQWLL